MTLPYRPCAAVMLLNEQGKVFVGQRLDSVVEAWQMPQGGIDEGEQPEAAAIRELGEETGIAPEHIELVARAPEPLLYELPPELIGKIWNGRYCGQSQIWFLARFTGTDEDIDIATEHREFRAWRWAEPSELPELIVPFKRALYERVLEIFADHLRAPPKAGVQGS